MCILVLPRLQTYLQGHAGLGTHLMLVIATATEWSVKTVLLAFLALP